MGIAKSHGLVLLRLQKGPHMCPDEERKVVQKLLDASLLSFSASAGILSCIIQVKPVFLYTYSSVLYLDQASAAHSCCSSFSVLHRQV